MFEVLSSDLLGRKGIIYTSKGKIRTPCFVPVVHPDPKKNLVDVNTFQTLYDIDIIITSSYILRKNYSNFDTLNLHKLTSFEGPIMTDSGAYQSLVYGEINVTPESVINFQEKIDSDFGVPLDIPISIKDNYETAKLKVETTLSRCNEIDNYISSSKVKWIGPIQGGRYLDLIAKSAKTISSINAFSMFALGSVVELMSNYQYEIVLNMILTAKRFLNPSKPLHLFGAGHPAMFPLIVAAGCDSFDSASYSLYAQDERYITNTQTFQLTELEEFPCNCPICTSTNPKALQKTPKVNRMKSLAAHNLHVCQSEMRNIRRAISSGTLWELLESRVRAHPSLMNGFSILQNHINQLQSNSPVTKKKGIFLVSDNSLARLEIKNHLEKIQRLRLGERKKLILISLIDLGITETYDLIRSLKALIVTLNEKVLEYDIWLLDPFFGIVPLEISEVFPLVQYLATKNILRKKIQEQVINSFSKIRSFNFDEILFLGDLTIINELSSNSTSIYLDKKFKTIHFSLSIEKINLIKEILEELF